MGNRSALTLGLDALMLLAVVLLLSPRLTGLPWHEVLGIALSVPLVIHLLISWEWIRRSTMRFFSVSDRRARVNYALNAILFVLITLEIVSGLAISQVALPSLGVATINDRSWRALHNLSLNWTVLVVGLHLAMNWDWITSTIRRRHASSAQEGRGSRLQRTVTRLLARILALLAAGSLVAALAWAILGPPSMERQYRQNEIERFAPSPGHGLGQMAGEAFLIVVVVYVGRRWLRVKV